MGSAQSVPAQDPPSGAAASAASASAGASAGTSSGSSSNLTPRHNTPAHRSVAEFVRAGPNGSRYTLDGERGSGKARLCRVPPAAGAGAAAGRAQAQAPAPVPAAAPQQGQLGAPQRGAPMDCVDIALEAKDLFATMQHLNFFCQLPQDPSMTHIICEKIPQ